MNARHRIARDPATGTAHFRATAIVQRATGTRISDLTPTRHRATTGEHHTTGEKEHRA